MLTISAYLLVLPLDSLDRLFTRSITSTYIRAHFHHNSGQRLEITHSQCAQSPPTNISARLGAESGHAFSHRVVAIQDANSVYVSSRALGSGRFVLSKIGACGICPHLSASVCLCLDTGITMPPEKERKVRAEMLRPTKLRIARLSFAFPSAEPMGPAFPRTILLARDRSVSATCEVGRRYRKGKRFTYNER